MTKDEEEAAVEFLVAKAARLKARQASPDPYKRGKDYDLEEAKRILIIGRKICTKCRQEKLLEEFSVTKSHPTGKKSECKACASLRFSKYRARDPEGMRIKDRLSHYTRSYGMTLDEAAALIIDRTGLCEGCRRMEPLVVDHNHETNKRRGMLCNRCNRILGLARDNPDTLISLVEYLSRSLETQDG